MAKVIWTEPALTELDAIADYIVVDNPAAAHRLVHRVFEHVEHLAIHPRSGPRLRELAGDRYRQIVEPPCRVVYRVNGDVVFVVAVVRTEQQLKAAQLARRVTGKRGKR